MATTKGFIKLMKTEMTIEFKNFDVPGMVIEDQSIPRAPISQGPPPPVAIPIPVRQYLLSELPANVLNELCDQFKRDVFTKAGATYPPSMIAAALSTVAPEIPHIGEHGEKVVISYPGGQWISPDFEPPIDGEVYQVYNGARHIAKYHEKLGWYTSSGSRAIDNVIYYTTAAPIPGE